MAKILVVDDEENIVQTLRYNLLRKGYCVSVSTDGGQALALFRQEKFDMVILDLMLPGMSGLDICNQLRVNSDVPIIILSALEEPFARVAGLDLTINHYMTKPFNLQELLAWVQKLLS